MKSTALTKFNKNGITTQTDLFLIPLLSQTINVLVMLKRMNKVDVKYVCM